MCCHAIIITMIQAGSRKIPYSTACTASTFLRRTEVTRVHSRLAYTRTFIPAPEREREGEEELFPATAAIRSNIQDVTVCQVKLKASKSKRRADVKGKTGKGQACVRRGGGGGAGGYSFRSTCTVRYSLFGGIRIVTLWLFEEFLFLKRWLVGLFRKRKSPRNISKPFKSTS